MLLLRLPPASNLLHTYFSAAEWQVIKIFGSFCNYHCRTETGKLLPCINNFGHSFRVGSSHAEQLVIVSIYQYVYASIAAAVFMELAKTTILSFPSFAINPISEMAMKRLSLTQ